MRRADAALKNLFLWITAAIRMAFQGLSVSETQTPALGLFG
jgi:hypothetical protein